jgi:serine/threonine protein kinase
MEFDMEIRTSVFADYHSKNYSGHQPGAIMHMIPLLATFEIQDPQQDDSEYHLLFDWAEGNLQQFWKSNETMVRDLDWLKWTAKQFCELARALHCIHNDLERMPSANTYSNLYGRHGDIKPSNFLYFKLRDGSKILVMSDFGLGRLHSKISKSNADPRNMPMTISYRAPEFDLKDGKISPRSDVYSMGCVFLEHITWFLRGKTGVDDFASRRLEIDKKYKFELDTFFELSDDERTATTKGKVKEWIEELKQDEACCEYLFKMLNLIEKRMLDPNSDTRIHAGELTNELKKMLRCGELSKSFYTKHWTKSMF